MAVLLSAGEQRRPAVALAVAGSHGLTVSPPKSSSFAGSLESVASREESLSESMSVL